MKKAPKLMDSIQIGLIVAFGIFQIGQFIYNNLETYANKNKINKIVKGKEITIVIASLNPANATFEQTKKEVENEMKDY